MEIEFQKLTYHITTFRSTPDRIYNGGPIRSHKIIMQLKHSYHIVTL
uniref:Uncharacterized protein n=1 Tax=Paramormyrops kingsleyae TaxID=1676925 RepID=A0A3B3Q5D8_9TELE